MADSPLARPACWAAVLCVGELALCLPDAEAAPRAEIAATSITAEGPTLVYGVDFDAGTLAVHVAVPPPKKRGDPGPRFEQLAGYTRWARIRSNTFNLDTHIHQPAKEAAPK